MVTLREYVFRCALNGAHLFIFLEEKMKNKRTLLDKLFDALPAFLLIPFSIVFIVSIIGFFIFPILFIFVEGFVNTVTIVIFIVCFVVGGLPVVFSCIQLTDKNDVKNAFKSLQPQQTESSVVTKNGTLIHCPTCQSTNVVRISLMSKAINVYAFGVFGNKRKKQFKCNNCGYMW